MVQLSEPGLTRGRRAIARLTLGGLALAQGAIGVWALLGPGPFYATFPTAGHAWVALLPPYNEHLVRDVGALSLALTVLLATAAVVPSRLLVRTAVAAFAIYAVPHTLFHGRHLEGFSDTDALAQMSGFAVQLLTAAVALWAVAADSRSDPASPPTEST
jgi:hypothetical protein